ncbi:MAG: tetratricopeptide repeat protein [Lachnospiraceae bacterium]|nr:tetratricopeptide repeat protein [Lachnospiraceae bacterium]
MTKKEALALKIFVGAVLVATLLFGAFYFESYRSVANEVADQINKGNAYMEAECYAEAIECYERALEHEEGNEKIKSAIVLAYMSMASDYGNSDEALLCYQNAIGFNPNNKTAYWSIANIYEERGDEDTMLDVLHKGFEDTGDESMNAKVFAIEEKRARLKAEEEARIAEEEAKRAEEEARAEKLEQLRPFFEDEDYDGLKEKLREEEYVAFSEEVIGDNSYYSGDHDVDGRREGYGIAVYENGYYYYGQFHEDQRSGKGVMIRANYSESSSIGSFIYDGEWSNDKPNGAGTAKSNYYKDRISASDFASKEIKGNYTDGLEDGEMTLVGVTRSGAKRTFKYRAENGVAEKSSNDSSGVKGQYIIAQTEDKSESLTSDGSKRGVEGFVEEEE